MLSSKNTKFLKSLCLFLVIVTSFQAKAAPSIEKLSEVKVANLIEKWADFDAKALCDVAKSSGDYLNKGKAYDANANHAGIFSQHQITVSQVLETLDFLCQTYQQDKQLGRDSRLKDSAYLKRHFDFYRWQPDMAQVEQFATGKRLLQNLPDDKILLTKYYVKQAQGSLVATDSMPHALYAVPFDEASLTLEQADLKKAEIARYRYTKHQVLTGVLEQKQLAKPLVYLSRVDLEDALMQGTVKVLLADGSSKIFNVHRNNGHAYDRNIKKEQQKRYWYFKEVPSVKGYGKDADYKIDIAPKVTVAGDLALFGLGKLVLLNGGGESRLSILADTGGAFEQNGYQLDYLSGFYQGWKDYYRVWKVKPDYYHAYFLVKKR